MDSLGEFIVTVLVFGFVGWACYFLAMAEKSAKKAWLEVAEKLDFAGLPNTPEKRGRMSGLYRGYRVECWIRRETRSGGRSKYTVEYTCIHVDLTGVWEADILLTPRGVKDIVAEAFGAEDQKVGVDRFDKDIRVQGELSPEITEVLRSPVVDVVFQDLLRKIGTFRLQSGSFDAEIKDMYEEPQQVIDCIDAVIDVADIITGEFRGDTGPPIDDEDELFPDVDEPEVEETSDLSW